MAWMAAGEWYGGYGGYGGYGYGGYGYGLTS